jgi:hypothetical protein
LAVTSLHAGGGDEFTPNAERGLWFAAKLQKRMKRRHLYDHGQRPAISIQLPSPEQQAQSAALPTAINGSGALICNHHRSEGA